MPVEWSVEVSPIGQERFHAVDRVVMQHVFDIHNTLGRFCDERIHQEELAQCRRAGGFEVQQLMSYETHLVRLPSHTRLDRIHWINLDRRTVTLRTLNK